MSSENPMPPLQPAERVETAEPVQPVQPVQPVEQVQSVQPTHPVKRVVPVEYAEPVAQPEYVVPVSRIERSRQIIYLILGILETLLIIRLIMRLLAANPGAAFSRIIYGITFPFVAPFEGVFPAPQADGSVFEVATLLAIIVYLLLVWAIVRIIEIRGTRRPGATL